MLLLLWKADSGLGVGEVLRAEWFWKETGPPILLCSAQYGVAAINPYLPNTEKTFTVCGTINTAYAFVGTAVYQDNVMFGTDGHGVLQASATALSAVPCDPIEPADIGALLSSYLTSSDGLPSDTVVAVAANGSYLAVATTSGVFYKNGEDPFVSYMNNNVSNVKITNSCIYCSEGSSIKYKANPVEDFASWDHLYDVGAQINDVVINTVGEEDYIFLATTDGVHVLHQGVDSVIQGGVACSKICVEYDTTSSWGHVLVSTESSMLVINMRDGLVENEVVEAGIRDVVLPPFWIK